MISKQLSMKGRSLTVQRPINKSQSVLNKPGYQTVRVQSAPVAKSNKITINAPMITTLGKGDIRVKHSEYIAEVPGSVNFSAVPYIIQPGLQSSFPWLSNMAALYESYVVHNIQYHFYTEKSTATNGVVMLAVDYDVQDNTPTSKLQLMTYQNAVRTAPWQNVTYNCEKASLLKFKERYVRSGLIANSDLKTFDIGNLFIATQGCIDTSVLGELHVSYDITFKTPQYDASGYASQGSAKLTTNSAPVTGPLVLGNTAPTIVPGSGMVVTYNTSTGSFTFGNVGQYYVYFNFQAGVSGTPVVTFTGQGSTAANVTPNYSTSLGTVSFNVNIINITDSFVLSGLTFASSTSAVMRVASYPYAL